MVELSADNISEFESKGEFYPIKALIANIGVEMGSPLKTDRGIGIGSTYAEVKAAYRKNLNHADSNREMLVVGSVYDGIVFRFNSDSEVAGIYIGAAAE